ncbi:MAG: hypothetical protein ACFE7E_03255 [Candidatus Hodarchaeota archaeon]
MIKNRILILHSFKDKRYESVLHKIADNPSLKGISFSHFWLIDHDRSSSRIQELDNLADQGEFDEELLKEVVKKEVGPLLDDQIAEFNPEVIIIKGGTIFTAVPGACIAMIIDLMKKYPRLEFALSGKSEWLVRRSGKTYHPFERKAAINQIRWVKENFIDDDEVEEIIKALFG